MADKRQNTITEEEAKLYDRQIRLWGIEAQSRMRNASILLVNMGALNTEVCKNIVLAGVRAVTLLDSNVVREHDLGAQFFLDPSAAVGTNRAESAVARAQQLNPNVEVRAEVADVATKAAEYFAAFDVVLVTGVCRSEAMRVNEACRAGNTKFYWADLMGFFGFFFADLLEHEFSHELPPANTLPTGAGADEREAERPAPTTERRQLSFVPLRTAYAKSWSGAKPRALKRLPRTMFGVRVLHEFREVHGRFPGAGAEDAASLAALRESVLVQTCGTRTPAVDVLPAAFLDQLATHAGTELAPVAAIVGGVLAQDVLKAVSLKDAPVHNSFFWDAWEGSGVVEALV